MNAICCVVCKTNDENVIYHEFPKSAAPLIRWLKILRLSLMDMNENSLICSKHFHPTCYFRNRSHKLLPGALPNKQPYKRINFQIKRLVKNLHQKHVNKAIHSLESATSIETDFTNESDSTTSPSKLIEETRQLELANIDFSNLEATTKLFHLANEKVKSYTKKIKSLQQTYRRQQKRVNKLLVILRNLEAET